MLFQSATTLMPASIACLVTSTSAAPLTGITTKASYWPEAIASCIWLICLAWSNPASNAVTFAPCLSASSCTPS
jgi:hypothetical protein